jgi:hypothetical protein
MFKKLAPQKAQHKSGYIVQTGGRYTLQYIDGDLLAEVDVDFGPVTTVYPESMRLQKSGTQVPVSPEQRATITDRMVKVLTFWNMNAQIQQGRR